MSSRLLAGRYELIEKIGEGGMAIVYKAKCRLLNRYVAIKILRPEFTKTDAFVENFRRESQAAAGLTHPNIVSVFDVGKEGNIHYIVMELIEGKPLSEIIEEKGKIEYKEAIEITRQIASALSEAHKKQIVHRDIKPHNIMITETGVAKLADFGIAKAVSDTNMVDTNNEKVMGSVHYLSPEQARGAYVDERTDIYSLGIVLYEMLTGQVPFDGDSAVEIALKHINDPMVPPSQLVAGIPPQLEKLILKATDKYQSNRFKTADEIIEELDNIDFITKAIGKSVFIGTEAEVDKEENLSDEKSEEKESIKDRVHDKKTGNSNKKIVGIAIAAVAFFAVCVIGVIAMLGFFGNESEEIVLPDLSGYTYDEAKVKLESMGLVIAEGEHVYSPDQEEGKITSQTPSADSVVSEGNLVTVNISLGKKDGIVPSLIGKNYEDAEEQLEELGFEIGKITVVESTEEKDTILKQSVKAGESAEKGTKIDIEVSDGSHEVPDLIGKNYKSVKSDLEKLGLELGVVTVVSGTEAADTIISQSVDAGSIAKDGTVIDVQVSDGKEVVLIEVPNLMGFTLDEARSKLEKEKLTIGDISYEENEYATPDTVIYQGISPGTEVEEGTAVSVTIVKAAEVIPDVTVDEGNEGDEGSNSETNNGGSQEDEEDGAEE